MKKTLWVRSAAILCAMAMTVSTVGCVGSGSKKKVDNTVEDTKHLVIMTSVGGYGSEYLEALIDAFEKKNEGVTVELTVTPSNSSVMAESLKNPEKNDVDLYFCMQPATSAESLRYAWNGEQALRDMTYLYDSQIPGEEVTLGEKVNPTAKLFCQTEGRTTEDTSDDVYYGIPGLVGPMALYYNETVINNALGKGNWSVPKTSDELIALCARLKEKDVHFLMPGGLDGYSRSLFLTWWAQYEGYDNFLKFFEGTGYDVSKDREVENSYYIFQQPGRKASLEASYDLVSYKNGYSLPNSVEINVSVLNEWQTRFFIAKNKLAFYPTGSWLGNEVIADTGVDYDSQIKMMKNPVISSIIESTDSYSGSDDKRLPNITSDKILSQVVAYVDGEGKLPAGVTEEEVAFVRQARNTTACLGESGCIIAPAYSNAKKLADEFLLFMASDEGIQIVKENTYGSFLPYNYEYKDLDALEQSIADVVRDAIFVDDVHYSPVFYRGGVSAFAGYENNTIDTLLCKKDGPTGTEIFERIAEAYGSGAWSSIMQKVE